MPAPTLTMQAPTPAYTSITTKNGNTYYSSATGLVANVLASDAVDLMSGGWTIVGPGFAQFGVSMLDGKNLVGTPLAASAGAGVFGMAISLGTSVQLVSEVANDDTKTDHVMWEVELPASFPPGYSPTITINTDIVIGSGTLSVATILLAAYPQHNDGTQSANIVTTTAQTMTNAAEDIVFATSAVGLEPGQRLFVEATMVLTETASSAVHANINSLRFS